MTLKIKNALVLKYAELKFGIETMDKVGEGWMSDNFVIKSNKKKYFLKCYRYQEKQRIIDTHKAKSFFSSRGIPVILPIPAKRKEVILKIEGRYFSLFPFVSGFHFNHGKIPPLAAGSLGQMLGRIHRAGERGYRVVGKRFNPWNKKEFYEGANAILKVIGAKKEKTDFDLAAERVLQFKKRCVAREKIQYADFKNLRIGLIHGDYHNGNVFFNKKGVVTHVFDFEKTCIAPFVFEIIRAIQYSHVTGYGRRGSEKPLERFLNGYQEERPITKNELRDGMEIFYQKQIHDSWVEQEHYLNNNTRVDNLLHTVKYLEYLDELREDVDC